MMETDSHLEVMKGAGIKLVRVGGAKSTTLPAASAGGCSCQHVHTHRHTDTYTDTQTHRHTGRQTHKHTTHDK